MKRRLILLIAGFIILAGCSFTILKLKNSVAGSNNSGAFQSFPMGKMVKVDLNFPADFDNEFTDREKNDQAKDWLLFTCLSDAGLSADELNQITYDLSATRQGYNRNVFNLDYGSTRSRYIGNGVVIAIIPVCSGDVEKDFLSNIVDEQRKNLGKKPEKLEVFQYKIDVAENAAAIVHVPAPSVNAMFTADYGYYEQKVANLNDLQKFMAAIHDVTYAANKDDGLILGGRMIKSRPQKKIEIEDIAAIWQSEKAIQRKKDDFESEWAHKTYSTDEEKEALKKQQLQEYRDLKIVNGSGFSLDPVFDYQKLNALFTSVAPMLKAYTTVSKIDDITHALKKNDEGPLFTVIAELQDKYAEPSSKEYEFVQNLRATVFSFRIQKARYDGELQGTAVGMHLFYTDLLAKLWTINFVNSSPQEVIEGFVNDPQTSNNLAKIYAKEAERFPSARLWFGPNSLGYQVADDSKQLLFARISTKIFSASSNPLKPANEVITSALFDASTDWWNNHYEEVAQYEQEYIALNEIMKWSTIIGWLNANYASAPLDFLSDVSVNNNNWFGAWAKKQTDLKFDQWDKVKLFAKGYKGFDTETLPLLSSNDYYANFGNENIIKGGVSLAEKSTFQELKALSQETNDLIRRSNLDYGSIGNELKTLKGSSIKLLSEESAFKVIAKAEDNALLRSRFGELSNNSFEKNLAKSANELSLKVGFNGSDVGILDVKKTQNGFAAGFQSRDVDKGQSLAKKISDAFDPDALLSSSPEVKAYVKLNGEGEYLIKQNEASKWMHLKMEKEADISLSAQWDARVSGNQPSSKVCNIKWLNESDIEALKSNNKLVLDAGGKLKLKPVVSANKNKLVPFELKGLKIDIKASLDTKTSEIIFDESVLADQKLDISSLQRALKEEDLTKIKQIAAQGKRFEYTVGKNYSGNEILSSYQSGNYKNVLSQLNETKDIGRFKTALQEERIADFKKIDKLEDLRARFDFLNELEMKYGDIPEINFRKGLLELDVMGYREAESFINQSIKNKGSSGKFFDEVNNLIKKSPINAESRETLLQAHAFNFDNAKFVQGTFDQVPKGSHVSFNTLASDVKQGKATLIFENNPSLNNLDWNVAINQSVAPSISNPVIIRIDPMPLSAYDMHVVVKPDFAAGRGIQNYSFTNTIRMRQAISFQGNNNDDDDKKKKGKTKYYIYIPKQANEVIPI